MIVRVIYNPDKTIGIVYPAQNSRKENETEQQWRTRVFDKAVQGRNAQYDDIDDAQLPKTDRYAWEGEKGKPININPARVKALNDKVLIEQKKKDLLEQMAITELKKEKLID